MTTFPYTPKSATLEVAPNLYSAKFGDGYEQAAPQGINYLPQKWSLVFNSNVSSIKAFLATLGGYQSFHWTPPNASNPLAFVCKSWSEQDTPGGIRTLNCTFEQRFVDSYTSAVDVPDGSTFSPATATSYSISYTQIQSLTDLQLQTARSNLGLTTVAWSGNYSDLNGTPSIPTVPALVSAFTNDAGYLTRITAAQVKSALGISTLTGSNTGDETSATIISKLGFTPYNASNPNGYLTGITSAQVVTALGFTPTTLAAVAGVGYATGGGFASGTNTGDETAATIVAKLSYTPESTSKKGVANGYAPLGSDGKVPSSYLPATSSSASATSTDVVPEGTTNLYFTQARARAAISVAGSLSYSSGVISYTAPNVLSAFTNDVGYLTTITSTQVKSALGISTLSGSNTGDETSSTILSKLGITTLSGSNTGDETSATIISKLGFTPYSSANPSGYITSSSLTPYALLSGAAFTGAVSATSFSGPLTGAHDGPVGATTPSSGKFLHAYSPTITLTDAASIAWNVATGQVAKVTLGGSRTMAAPTNLQDGACYTLNIIQDTTGSRTLSWNSVFAFTGGTAPTLSTAANAVDKISFQYDGTKLRELGRSLGTA